MIRKYTPDSVNANKRVLISNSNRLIKLMDFTIASFMVKFMSLIHKHIQGRITMAYGSSSILHKNRRVEPQDFRSHAFAPYSRYITFNYLIIFPLIFLVREHQCALLDSTSQDDNQHFRSDYSPINNLFELNESLDYYDPCICY